jgi:hypothetical protein
MKKIFLLALACLTICFVHFNPADVSAKTYTGTLYVAGMGGHFAIAEVLIDPSNKTEPIKVVRLKQRVVIGKPDTHPTHDARIDITNRNKMFWSTYKFDKKAKAKNILHVGVSDLLTRKVIIDRAIPLDPRAMKFTKALFCGSGQTEEYYIPVTMTKEAYIDIYYKKDLSLKHRVFLDKLGYKDNYLFFHGTNSPDLKKFEMAINLTNKGKPNGKIDILLLDLRALVKGKVKLLKKVTHTGEPGKTLTFRQYFTPNGKYILQSAADRFWLLDAKSLKLLDEEMVDGQNHDAIATPDSRYAVLTLRKKIENDEGEIITDGMVQLYDIKKRRVIGRPVSVCYRCHRNVDVHKNAILCGLDANWKQ